MAYSTATAPAAGKTLAFDGDFPRSALVHGAEGAKVDASAANPLPVAVIGGLELGSTSLTALETIDLGASSLAALENLTVGGTVELGASSLAALETINVGTVELGSTSLAALETVTVGGTVELGATSLAALESVTTSGPLTDTQLRATALPVSATALPLPAGAATAAGQAAQTTALGTLLTDATFTTRQPTTGAKAASGSVPIVISNDQDPILDHANAVIFTVTNASQTAITPPVGARYAVFTPSVDMFVRTDGAAASATAAGSVKLFANVPRDLPVVGGTAVTAIVASGTGELRVTPSKSR